MRRSHLLPEERRFFTLAESTPSMEQNSPRKTRSVFPEGFPCFHPPSLKGLTDLGSLNLANTKVTDAGLKHLKGLTKLQEVDLMLTQVTDAGVKKLQLALPKCEILH